MSKGKKYSEIEKSVLKVADPIIEKEIPLGEKKLEEKYNAIVEAEAEKKAPEEIEIVSKPSLTLVQDNTSKEFIELQSVAVELEKPKIAIIRELEIAVNECDNSQAKNELNSIIEVLMKLRNQTSMLYTNKSHDYPIVKRIKAEVLDIYD